MNARKSGLADSPFFRPESPLPSPPPQSEPVQISSVQPTPQSVPVYMDAQLHERTNEQTNNHTDEQPHNRATTQLHERTTAQSHSRTTEQLHERADAQSGRPKSRESYDVYEDQAQGIEELQLKWGRARRKYITKGQVMRELLDEILPTKR